MNAFLATVILSLSVYQGAVLEHVGGFGNDNPEAKHISMVQLLANPDTWNNRMIAVEGVLAFEHEGNALYLGPDDADSRITKNAVWLNISSTLLKVPSGDPGTVNEQRKASGKVMALTAWSGEYVVVQGVYNSLLSGHMGRYSGSIEVTRIHPKGKE